jgi:uncharacterized protein (TIGR03382 family)
MFRFLRLLPLVLFVQIPASSLFAEADGEPVFRNLQGRDSVLIGDQIRYGLRFSVEDGSILRIPDFPAVDGVEIISGFELDTLKSRKGMLDMEGSVVLTSFDSGSFVLPPVKVEVERPDGTVDTLAFRGDTLHVTTFPIDTASFVKHDIKGQIRYPITFMEILPWLGGAIALCLVVLGLVWLLKRRKKAGSRPSE